MTTNLPKLLAFTAIIVLTSCGGMLTSAPGTVSYDSEKQHDEILRLNDKQIFENLARAKNGQAVIISQYSQVYQELSTTLAATFGSGRTITDNSYPGKSVATTVNPQVSPAASLVATTVGSTSAILQTAVRPLSGMVNPERDHTLSFTQDPVYGDDAPYKAYRTFLSLSSPGGKSSNKVIISQIQSVQSGDAPPPKDKVCFPRGGAKKWDVDGKYYWVPKAYQPDFFTLALNIVAGHTDGNAPAQGTDAIVKQLKVNNATLRHFSN